MGESEIGGKEYWTACIFKVGVQSSPLLFLRPKWGWHLNISVTPSDFRPLPHPLELIKPKAPLWAHCC